MSSTSTWGRLRWPFKAVLIAAPIIALGYFAINDGWFMNNGPVDNTVTTRNAQAKDESQNAETKAAETKDESRIFAFQPEKPVNGEIKGIVEVGATGFNSFVINMDKERRWEIKSKDFG